MSQALDGYGVTKIPLILPLSDEIGLDVHLQ